jgi:hypothetical protein
MHLSVGKRRKASLFVRRRAVIVTAAVLLVVGCAGFAAAQYGRFYRNDFTANQPTPSNTEFVFARVQFNSGNGGFGFRGGGDGWAHDYPVAEHHILDLASRLTRIHVQEQSYIIVQLESEEIFEYPFLYFSEVCEMNMTPKEIENFREYLGRGGIAMIDDFDNARSLAWFSDQMHKIFPERDFEDMKADHPIFHSAFDVEISHVVPPFNYGEPPAFYGYFDDSRRVSMIINHNNDIGDFWEWLDQPVYPLEGSIAGVRLGINYLLYSMSH